MNSEIDCKKNTEKEQLWTKDFIIVSAINFLLTMGMMLLMVTIGVYTADKFQSSESVSGLVSGIYIIGALIGRLGTGGIIGRIGSKKVLVAGMMLYAASVSLYFISSSISLLLMARILHGITVGIAVTATGTIAAQIIPIPRRGEGIGYYSMGAVIATAVGPFLGIFLLENADFKAIFWLCFFLGVVGFIASISVKTPKAEEFPLESQDKPKGISKFLEKSALPISFVVLIVAFVYSGVLSFLTLYAKELHMTGIASYFFVAYAAISLVARPFAGRVMDRRGDNVVMYPTLCALAIGMLLISQVRFGWMLILSALIIGFGYGNSLSCGQAIALKKTSDSRVGLATSTFFVFLDFGLGFGPYVLGMIIPLLGYRGMYLVLSAVGVGCIFLYRFIYGRKQP